MRDRLQSASALSLAMACAVAMIAFVAFFSLGRCGLRRRRDPLLRRAPARRGAGPRASANRGFAHRRAPGRRPARPPAQRTRRRHGRMAGQPRSVVRHGRPATRRSDHGRRAGPRHASTGAASTAISSGRRLPRGRMAGRGRRALRGRPLRPGRTAPAPGRAATGHRDRAVHPGRAAAPEARPRTRVRARPRSRPSCRRSRPSCRRSRPSCRRSRPSRRRARPVPAHLHRSRDAAGHDDPDEPAADRADVNHADDDHAHIDDRLTRSRPRASRGPCGARARAA